MALVWPWSVVDPRNPLRAIEYFSRFFEEPWQELFGGALISVPDMPRSYVPTLLALKLPEIFLVLGFGGAAGALIAAFRRDVAAEPARGLSPGRARRPAAACRHGRAAAGHVQRHPAFRVRAAAARRARRPRRRLAHRMPRRDDFALRRLLAAVVLVGGIALPVLGMVRLHPYEYTHFNWLAGGVRARARRYMLDYWGLAFKQASQALLAKLAERRRRKPGGRRWKIAVCGPHRSPQVELGPDFETTWDPQGADFAMMLGVFYCAKLDAPVLVEIVRDGVVYARVYDIRGRSFPTLLTQPGLKPL